MAVADPVAHEARLRPRFAILAALAGICLFGAAALQSVGPQAAVSELTVQLLVTSRRSGLEVAGAVINSLGLLGLAGTLSFLFFAARARKPDMSQATWLVTIVGGALAAIGGIVYGVVITIKAHQFATTGLQTYPQANSLLSGGAVAALQYAALLGELLLAVGFVLITLNAMRIGLLTKFVGYLGMAAAAASLLLAGQVEALLIEVFWLFATAYLLLGRWPNGDPPAWRSGEAVPWPTAAELRAQRDQAAGRRNGKGAPAPKPKQAQPAPVATAPAKSTRASTPKRKRKRRK